MSDKPRSGFRKVLRVLRWLIPIALVAGAFAFRSVVAARVQARVEAPPIPVRTAKPERGDLSRLLKLNGHVESQTMVTVLPLVSGVLQELYVEVGQHVEKDQVIARIDAQRFELQLQQAEAAYFSAKSTYERIDQLFRASATTQQSYEQAKGQYDAYASQYELAKLQLGYANVKSPVDGVVLVKHVPAGSIAAPERPLVTLGDINDLVVKARIPEKYYETFRSGGLIAIRVLRPGGATYYGSVRSVSPFISAETKNFETVVSIGGSTVALRPGMFVNVEFELARWNGVYKLPFEALSSGGRLWWVENGVAKSEAFEPTQASDEAFAVPETWAQREFVVEGHFFLREGSAVAVLGGPES